MRSTYITIISERKRVQRVEREREREREQERDEKENETIECKEGNIYFI